MSGIPADLSFWDRAALGILCLILAASVSMTAYNHGEASHAADRTSEAIDLGAGVSLPRAKAVSQKVRVGSCRALATIYFVSPLFYGVGPSLNAPPHLDDRVYYAYRGRMLGGRFASTALSMMYVARLALGVLRMSEQSGVDDLAVKIIVPAGCDATPAAVIVAVREQVQARP